MIEYEKIYEDVISVHPRIRTQASNVKIHLPKGVDEKKMAQYANDFAHKASADFFEMYVRYQWLINSMGVKNGKCIDRNHYITRALRRVLYGEKAGHDIPFYGINTVKWLRRYTEELFPSLILGNPFENPEDYTYPYEHATLEHLHMVHQMPQRFDLLAIVEERKMDYAEFYNYVINFISCHNIAVGKTVFVVKKVSGKGILYIKNNY